MNGAVDSLAWQSGGFLGGWLRGNPVTEFPSLYSLEKRRYLGILFKGYFYLRNGHKSSSPIS